MRNIGPVQPKYKGLLSLVLLMIFFFGTTKAFLAQQPETTVIWNQPIQIPSPEDSRSWFPDVAIDSKNNVHFTWNETKSIPGEREVERVFYSMWDGEEWTNLNDILAPQPDINRHAITIDLGDTLHLVNGWFSMFYRQSPANEAGSNLVQIEPRLINGRQGTYYKDIDAFQNNLYVVYDDAGVANENSPCLVGCADIFYRRSPDLGKSWGAPLALYPTDAGSARPQIEIDPTGALHISWDEGWDRLSGVSVPEQYGVYIYSADGGTNWSEPTLVKYPNTTNMQTAVGSNGAGGVMLVWRTVDPNYPGIYYMWSSNSGETWSPPQTIPGILARRSSTPFDKYDMATDSAGNIHLLAVGHMTTAGENVPTGLYHYVWNGSTWTTPYPIYEGSWLPEYPTIVVHNGNQLHATWFIRPGEEGSTQPSQVWYALGQSSAPEVIPAPLPTPTPIPSPVPPTATPTVTPVPTIAAEIANISLPSNAVDSIYTENDELWLLVQSLIPAALLLIFVLGGVRLWRR